MINSTVFLLFASSLVVNGGIVPQVDREDEAFKDAMDEFEPVGASVDEEGSLDETDFANGDAIDLDTEIPEGENPLRDAIEKGHLFEGDILLNHEQTAIIADESEDRSASTVPTHKWKKYGGNVIIPYTITKSYDSQERANIARAITEYRKNTCLRIVPRNEAPRHLQNDYIQIFRGGGCFSAVGRQGGPQKLSLGNYCATDVGTPIHELMHAIGYWHEQSRPDRDKYIDIFWGNIAPSMQYNFKKCDKCSIQGLSYDYASVMHYDRYAFSSNRGQTMAKKGCRNCKLGQRNGFSPLDIKGINQIYQCSDDGGDEDGTCSNKNSGCEGHAQDGFCKSYVDWMEKNCSKSCKFCSGYYCTDKSSDCPGHAKKGYCKSYVTWMKSNCKKACDFC